MVLLKLLIIFFCNFFFQYREFLSVWQFGTGLVFGCSTALSRAVLTSSPVKNTRTIKRVPFDMQLYKSVYKMKTNLRCYFFFLSLPFTFSFCQFCCRCCCWYLYFLFFWRSTNCFFFAGGECVCARDYKIISKNKKPYKKTHTLSKNRRTFLWLLSLVLLRTTTAKWIFY